MAVELGDKESGFRHKAVIEFINREVTLNGGGPDFYRTYRSQSWKEVEDQLLIVLSDPRVPETLKRASVWSGLALSVRLGAKQLDQDEYQLQQHISQYLTVSRAMCTELVWLRKQREGSLDSWHTTKNALEKALDELRRLESPTPALTHARCRAMMLQAIKHAERMIGGYQMPSESQGAASESLYYQSGPQSTRAQGLLPPSKPPLGNIDPHGEEEGSGSGPQEECSDPGAKKRLKVQFPQKSSMKTKMKKSAGYKHLKSRAYKTHPLDWQCLSCNMLNFSWRKFCLKCKKSFETVGQRGDQ